MTDTWDSKRSFCLNTGWYWLKHWSLSVCTVLLDRPSSNLMILLVLRRLIFNHAPLCYLPSDGSDLDTVSHGSLDSANDSAERTSIDTDFTKMDSSDDGFSTGRKPSASFFLKRFHLLIVSLLLLVPRLRSEKKKCNFNLIWFNLSSEKCPNCMIHNPSFFFFKFLRFKCHCTE